MLGHPHGSRKQQPALQYIKIQVHRWSALVDNGKEPQKIFQMRCRVQTSIHDKIQKVEDFLRSPSIFGNSQLYPDELNLHIVIAHNVNKCIIEERGLQLKGFCHSPYHIYTTHCKH